MTREKAIEKLEQLWNEVYNEDSDGYDYAKAIDMAIKALERKRGKWLLDGRCSECLVAPLTSHKNYCPNCGTDMRGDVNGNI